jgi:hypothetical protein
LSISVDNTTGNATITANKGSATTDLGSTVSINGVPVGLGKGNISSNVAIGSSALLLNTTGPNNLAVGINALLSNSTGNGNLAIGTSSLIFNTTGGNNISIGTNALYSNTTGNYNLAIGFNAARYLADGATFNATGANSVFLGAETKPLGAAQTNQIVIGYDATGLGSNTAVLGNASITTTALRGNVGIGTTAPSSNLTVAQGTAGVGTISVGAAGTTITGVGTQFLNTFAVGQTITSAGQTLTISAIASDTSMTISPAAGAAISGQAYTLVGGTRFTVAGNGKVGIGANTFLERDGDNTLALRNGAAAQTFRVYNTYTDASNYERGFVQWNSDVLQIGSERAGSGSVRTVEITASGQISLTTGGGRPIDFRPAGVTRWTIHTPGNLWATTDNAYDIGASGANRPRNVYVGSNVISSPAASITPANNSELVVEATSNTTLTFKLKGTDGTVRSATLTLAP